MSLILNDFKSYITSRKSDFLLSLYMMIRKRQWSFFLHWVNLILSKAIYLFQKRNINTDSLYDLFLNRYLVINEGNEIQKGNNSLFDGLLSVAKFMEDSPKKNDKNIKYILLENFTFIQNSLNNQVHFDNIPADLLSLLGERLSNSEIFEEAQLFSGCKLTVCNVRCWLFFPCIEKGDSNINPHTDWFPPGFLKIMFYKGKFTKDAPAINIYKDGKTIPVEGVNPILLFDANRVRHGAPAPINGCRPTVEITLMPQGLSSYQLLQAGFQAGFPTNPFRSYSRPYVMLYSR